MKARILDGDALRAISPAALSAYALSEGWEKSEEYGEHSDVYIGERLPEIILPRTVHIGDYVPVVSRLIEIFSETIAMDELALYRDLVTANRDVIRLRAPESNDGSVSVNDGAKLVDGARQMVQAAACSLYDPRPLYRAGANKEANDYLARVRLGQTEQGSFAITLLTPVISPPTQPPLDADWGINDDPPDRRVTNRLVEALRATRRATEMANSGEDDAFPKAVDSGVSANLCEALVQSISPFSVLDISLTWARTRIKMRRRDSIEFSQDDTPILSDAARIFRNREPKMDVRLFGSVHILKRGITEVDGTVTVRASIDGKIESVIAVLNQYDYERAILTNKDRVPVVMEGDLERVGQRWYLRNPRVKEVIDDADDED